ncbi:hypothetical protein D9M70_476490 [compost metagenome]
MPVTENSVVLMVPAGPLISTKLVSKGLPITAVGTLGSAMKNSSSPVSGLVAGMAWPLAARRKGPTLPVRAPPNCPGAPMPMSRVMLMARRPPLSAICAAVTLKVSTP